MLNQRLSDMKKTLQNEFKSSGGDVSSNANTNGSSSCKPNSIQQTTNGSNRSAHEIIDENLKKTTTPFIDDVNFKYLKHVILKFLTSREVDNIRKCCNLKKKMRFIVKITKL